MSLNHTPKQCIMAVIKSPAWVCLIWLGMTAGVSLLATPIRFTASTITRPVALDVGQVVFAALSKAEFAALIILLILVRLSGKAKEFWAGAATLTLILLAQAVWLLPQLAARTEQIIAGVEPVPSMVHGIYSVLELVKIFVLLFLGLRSMQMLVSSAGHSGTAE